MEASQFAENFSLLYSNGTECHVQYSYRGVSDALGLTSYLAPISSSIEAFLSCDAETVLYRQETVKDLLNCRQVLETLIKCVPVLHDIVELRNMPSDMAEDYLCSITEAELYLTLLDYLSEGILPCKDRLKGRAMTAFCEKIAELTQSEGYCKINKSLNELTSRVRDIKSVCLAVNLDGTLRPESIGLVSINDNKYQFANTVERILRIDRSKKEDNFCIAPLNPFVKNASEAEQTAMNIALNSAISKTFKNDFKSWKNIIKTYVLENTDFLINLLPECELLTKAVAFIDQLQTLGITLSFPNIVTDSANTFKSNGIINPVVALKTGDSMVKNDIIFDENAGLYIITGPNRGGKSVLTCAVGCAAVMTQLGLPVCADRLDISPCDNIFCHFPDGAEDTAGKGRLGEECERLSDIMHYVTKNSIVLLDESLSSTGSYEASCIAGEIVCALSVIGCRTVFSTHLHNLAAQIPQMNERCAALGGVKIDSLVADIDDGKRSFMIRRCAPVGKSFASDIADKYGLSLENILNERR